MCFNYPFIYNVISFVCPYDSGIGIEGDLKVPNGSLGVRAEINLKGSHVCSGYTAATIAATEPL